MNNIISKKISRLSADMLNPYYGEKRLRHLLRSWPVILEHLQNTEKILLLLDYDGTLTPIVERPELAQISEDTRNLLKKIMRHKSITIAIISGRAMPDLKEKINLEGVIYAGNHGFEIEGQGLSFINPIAIELKPVLRIMRQILTLALKTIKGVFVEDKGLSLTIHYRQADEKHTGDVKNILERILNGPLTSGKVKVTTGKKVFEVRPAVNWDKGKAVQLIMKRYSKGGRQRHLLPIYIGDDLTDEDAFKFIQRHGKGISILVGNPDPNSSAQYFVESTTEVRTFLGMLWEYLQIGK
jgi:trehalose 6-phosphate phosphatase